MFKAFVSPRLDEVSYGFDVIFMIDDEVISTMAFADKDTAEIAVEKWEKV
jgi:hypothetical protein